MLKHTRAFLQAGLAAMLLAGCGAQLGPHATGLKAHGLAAHAGWTPMPLELRSKWDWEFDRPAEHHPFAYPVDFRVRARDGSPAVELLAREVNRPVKGFAIIPLEDPDAGSFYDEDGEKLAKRVKLKFRWGNNTAQAMPDTALPAMVVFVVRYWTGEKEDDEEILGTCAIGYAWASKGLEEKAAAKPDAPDLLRKGWMYPPPEGNQQGMSPKPPMKITAEGSEGVPFRFIVKELGYGDNKPCSDESFRTMTIKEVVIDNLVKDVHAAFPHIVPRQESPTDGDPTAAPISVPEDNSRLRGIAAVAFGANVAPNASSQAVLLDAVEIQKSFR